MGIFFHENQRVQADELLLPRVLASIKLVQLMFCKIAREGSGDKEIDVLFRMLPTGLRINLCDVDRYIIGNLYEEEFCGKCGCTSCY